MKKEKLEEFLKILNETSIFELTAFFEEMRKLVANRVDSELQNRKSETDQLITFQKDVIRS